jgi:hypothetical protein
VGAEPIAMGILWQKVIGSVSGKKKVLCHLLLAILKIFLQHSHLT